jgi:ubiquinone/menaquinone biosynthesis C-methylase UbiE
VATHQSRATSFGAIAEDYDRLRQAPPEAAVEWLLPPNCEHALDLGAGTGLLTRALTGKVAHLIAVDPDARMLAVLTARSPSVHAVEGRGEAIPLPDASQDAVLVSSAWHWMHPGHATAEVARVLRDRGRFGVAWASRDRSIDWIRELDRLRVSTERYPDDGDVASRTRHLREVLLADNAPFDHVETASFPFATTMMVDDLAQMLATYSGVITGSAEERAAGLARTRAALGSWFPNQDEISVPMRAACWRADRVRRDAIDDR